MPETTACRHPARFWQWIAARRAADRGRVGSDSTEEARHRSWITTLALVVTLGALGCVWASRITGAAIEADASHSLRMGVHLMHDGVISMQENPPFSPTMYREPLPAFVDAVGVAVVDAIWGPSDMSAYHVSNRAKVLKYQNVGWMLLLSLGVFAAIRYFTSSFVLGLCGLVLASFHIPFTESGLRGLGIDTLQTDLPAAAILIVASLLAAQSFTGAKRGRSALAGCAFGALALVKAAFLYIFAGFLLILFALGAVAWFRQRSRAGILHASLMGVCFALIVAPWMCRNYVQFGVFGISERAGSVLAIRATQDLMTPEEYRGTFYVWAPHRLRPAVGRLLGFTARDLQRGGRLQHLNRSRTADFYEDDVRAERTGRPDLTVSYYRKAKAERTKLQLAALAAGHAHSTDVDTILQRRAIAVIREHPQRHLALTIPYLWRGAFAMFPVLVVTLAYALATRRTSLALFVLPAFGTVMFHALLTHFIPRYSVPSLPITIASGIILAQAVGGILLRRRRAPAVMVSQPVPAAVRSR